MARQLITESVLLGCLGGVSGVLASFWAVRILVGYFPADRIPLPLQLAADARVLVFAAATSCLSIMAFGLVPAWHSTKPGVVDALRDTRHMRLPRGLDLRRLLVIAQVTLALLLVVGGGLFTQSLGNMTAIDLGVDTDNVLMAGINPAQSGYTPERTDAFFRELEVRLRETSGVQAVGFTFLPLLAVDFFRDGEEAAVPADPGARATTIEVSHDFFAAAGITLLRGRTFGPQDTGNSARVAVISETAARFHFPGEDPLGKPAPLLRTAGEIIGIVRDARLRDVHQPPGSTIYMSSEQRGGFGSQQTVYIRTRGDAASFPPILQRTVSDLDSQLPLYDVKTFTAQRDDALARERLVATLSGFFAVLSLLLAAVGIYGVVAYSVVARTREIGVRMSLGAERGDVLWMIQRNALALTAMGIAIGIPLSLGLYRLLESQLFGVEANDGLTLAVTAGILTTVAVAAAWIPARRAASIDPATVLRCDQ